MLRGVAAPRLGVGGHAACPTRTASTASVAPAAGMEGAGTDQTAAVERIYQNLQLGREPKLRMTADHRRHTLPLQTGTFNHVDGPYGPTT